MSNARVRVEKYQWFCKACGTRSMLYATCATANIFADRHARSCPALRLARLREQITEAVAAIDWQRDVMLDYPCGGASRAVASGLKDALDTITEHTGITP